MYQYLYVGGCIIVYFAYLDFSFVNSFQDGVDDGRGGLAIRNLRDGECLVVQLVDLGAYFYRSAAFPSLYLATSMEPPVWKWDIAGTILHADS